MKNYRSIAKRIRGPLSPVLAAFDADDRLDIGATCRWVDWLIGKGIKLFWTTHGTTHFMCLSDSEIMELTKALAGVISGRGIFIASTAWNWPTQKCVEFVDYAARCGVDVVKLQIDWSWNPGDEQVIEHYRKIAESSPIPLFAYTLAVPSITKGVSVDLLKRIIELPQFIGLKNDTDDFTGQQDYLRVVRLYSDPSEFVVMTGGKMNAFLFGYDFGAKAYGDVVGWFAPEQAIAFIKYMEEGKRKQALQIVRDWEEPMFELWRRFGCGGHWTGAHTALQLMGLFKSNRMRFPLRTLNPNEAEIVKEFFTEKGVL